jgi:hypothetical protein
MMGGSNTAAVLAAPRSIPLAKRKIFNMTKALTKEPPVKFEAGTSAVEPPGAGPGSSADLLRIMRSQALSDSDRQCSIPPPIFRDMLLFTPHASRIFYPFMFQFFFAYISFSIFLYLSYLPYISLSSC